jgi:DNA-binding NtrC family response regulator
VESPHDGPRILGESPAARRLREEIGAAAPTDTVVLLAGPVGSGRELAARVLHASGPRAKGPFVVVPCAGLSAGLAESELFGHEKGAFTGAAAPHRGLIERASGGTVFFSEVAELPEAVQPKLLRFLEERAVTPLGADVLRPIDCRVLASTARDLAAEVRAGRFREDLYYRLRVLKIDVPPLADRREDIPLLAETFLDELANELGRLTVRAAARLPAPRKRQAGTQTGTRPALSEEAKALMVSHSWPGNVRELRNCLRGALVFVGGGTIGPEHLGIEEAPSGEGPARGGLKDEVARVVKETEVRLIQEALARSGGNRTRAAKELGLSRRGLQVKMRRYGIP